MAHDVFISHSTKDKQVADALCAALESEKIRCWLAPRDVPPGSDWASEIIKAVQGARAMVLVFSANAVDSTHMRKEITAAANAGITIVPLKIDATTPSGAMEYYLSDTHWLDALNPPTTEQIAEVVRRVANLLEKEFDAASLVVPTTPKPARRVPWTIIAAVLAGVIVIGGGVFAATQLLGDREKPPVTTDPVDGTVDTGTGTTPTAVRPSGTTSEVFPYADVVAGLPDTLQPLDLEVEIDSVLFDSEYVWLDFTGRWAEHDVKGSLTFLNDSFEYVSLEKLDDLTVDATDDAQLAAALEDSEYQYFYETAGYAPYGAKITVSYAFTIGDMQVVPGDTLTFDRDLRLVKTSW